MITGKWVLVHQETGKVFENSLTGKPFELDSRDEARHYLGCFGLPTFGEGEDQKWHPEYSGEIYSMGDYCKLVKKHRKDLNALKKLYQYLMEHKKKYSLVDLRFMVEFTEEKLEAQMVKEMEDHQKEVGGVHVFKSLKDFLNFLRNR